MAHTHAKQEIGAWSDADKGRPMSTGPWSGLTWHHHGPACKQYAEMAYHDRMFVVP